MARWRRRIHDYTASHHPSDAGTIGWAVVQLDESPFSLTLSRVTIPVAYCDGEELKYYPICLEGAFRVVSCDESSSSSSSSA